MVHIDDASIANAAVVRAIWLPHVAHLAISPSLRFIPHVEAPIGRDDARICHDTLVEGEHEVPKQNVIQQHYHC